MTLRNWPASVIRKTPVTPSGPYDNSSASGVWTIDEAAYWESINQWPSQSNPSPDKFIENLFSTYLYTGNDSAQTITNGIDLSGKGGMVWRKRRTTSGADMVMDTLRGTNALQAYSASGQFGSSDSFTALNNGFSFNTANFINVSGNNYASWTFRKQPKFFDVVTYTGDGTSGRQIPHNLGSVPGCIIAKATSTSSNWAVWHRGNGTNNYVGLGLNLAALPTASGPYSGGTSTNINIDNVTDNNFNSFNTNGVTYVAYLFAHDAGGFGLTGTDNVISCGSFTTDTPGNATVNLGYEPQWILTKPIASGYGWFLADTMRGMSQTSVTMLAPDTAAADNTSTGAPYLTPTATGFSTTAFWSSQTLIYIAIRRGPMKVPTSGTSVYANFYSNYSEGNILTSNFPVDLSIWKGNTVWDWSWDDRLRGTSTATNTGRASLASNSAAYENNGWAYLGAAKFDNNTGVSVSYKADSSRSNQASYALLRRAPGFFDEVCYTGTGANCTVSHNLGVVPEMMIIKTRQSGNWEVYHASLGNTNAIELDQTGGSFSAAAMWNSTTPTSTVFSLGTLTGVNANAATYVAYLFATCPGVSKVGSYTGTGTTKQIDCGFTSGARFVLIKRTDSTGDWYVWDSARGIVSGNDPYLLLNSTSAVNTSTDYIDPYTAGFEISSTAPAAINANGGTYIFLAIA